jgi:hypothetical protein
LLAGGLALVLHAGRAPRREAAARLVSGDDVCGDGGEGDVVGEMCGIGEMSGGSTARHSSRRRNTTPADHVPHGGNPPRRQGGRRRGSTNVLSHGGCDGHSAGGGSLSDEAAGELVEELRRWAARRALLANSERVGPQDQPGYATQEAGRRVQGRRISLLAGRRLSVVPAHTPPPPPQPLRTRLILTEHSLIAHSLNPQSNAPEAKGLPTEELSPQADTPDLPEPPPPTTKPPPREPPPPLHEAPLPPIAPRPPPDASPCGLQAVPAITEGPAPAVPHPNTGLLDASANWRSIVAPSISNGDGVTAAVHPCIPVQPLVGSAGSWRGDSHSPRSFRTCLFSSARNLSEAILRSLASADGWAAWGGRKSTCQPRTSDAQTGAPPCGNDATGDTSTNPDGGSQRRGDCGTGMGGSVAQPASAILQVFMDPNSTPSASVPSQPATPTTTAHSLRQPAVDGQQLPAPSSAQLMVPVQSRLQAAVGGGDNPRAEVSAGVTPHRITAVPTLPGMKSAEGCPGGHKDGFFQLNGTRLSAEL